MTEAECNHKGKGIVIKSIDVALNGKWHKAAQHIFCADCLKVTSLKDWPAVFFIMDGVKTREYISRDDRKEKEAS